MNIVIRVSGIIGYLIGYGNMYRGEEYIEVELLWPSFKFNNSHVAEKEITYFGEGDIVEFINQL